jgi:hypothetical protein
MNRIQPRFAANRIGVAAFFCGALILMSAGFCSAEDSAAKGKLVVDAKSFRCITEMSRVRHFYVDNLLGNVDATLAVANGTAGGAYPPGSVIQLVPNEAMVKGDKGSNPATNDWEFFFLDVSKDGTKIRTRGFADLVDPLGGTCFGCHSNANAKWDLVCEADHGCVAIPVTRPMAGDLQRTDPRCKNTALSAEDTEALRQLGELLKGKH